ncbi:MAG TPA: metallopeptidase TldD-related protein [Acidimicrobiales bacterium]|nr:metallopeptidase TldD-related protein [Acidimicrobiales bacterium]
MTALLDATAGVEVADRAVTAALAAGADEAQVLHVYDELFEITYDNDDVGMVRTTVDDEITLTVFVGQAKGQSSLTGRSHDLIEQAAAEAVAAARAGVADPANGIVEGAPTNLVELGDREPDGDAMIDAIVRHQRLVADEYPTIRMRDSTYDFRNHWRSFANSAGLQHQERRGSYTAGALFSAKDGERATSFNGVGASSVAPFAEIMEVPTLRRMLDDTVASFDPKPVPATFVGDVIFTPNSVDALLDTVLQALLGYALIRGTSPFKDSIGELIADARLTVSNAPLSPEFPLASAFDGNGVPATNLPIITNGVLSNHLIDWYASRKLGRPMTAGVFALDVTPGDQSLDDIIANTERGIVLGRFSGGVPNQQLDFSGVAKNSFYVEHGKVQFPINETMIAGNFAQLLQSIRAIGSESVNFGGYAFPALAASGVTISTK